MGWGWGGGIGLLPLQALLRRRMRVAMRVHAGLCLRGVASG